MKSSILEKEQKNKFITDLVFLNNVIMSLIGNEEMELLFANFGDLNSCEKDEYFEKAFWLLQEGNEQWQNYLFRFLYHNRQYLKDILQIMQVNLFDKAE